jgi:hypothetical protein
MAVDGRDPHRRVPRELYCEFELTLKGECCLEKGCVELEGLWLCEPHADRLWLEERAVFWRAVLAHIRLWSGEARSRERDDVVRLLEIERTRSVAALERVYEELHNSWDGRSRNGKVSRDGNDGSGEGRGPPI